MNVYDFDDTIYRGDSTADFIFRCLKKKPSLAFKIASCGVPFIAYLTKRGSKTAFKEKMYSFLQKIDNIDKEVEDFWNENLHNIKSWYKKQQRDDDVIISASPEFLLAPICKKLGIKYLIASQVNKTTGIYSGINCYGTEKVRRFYEVFGEGTEIDSFYSDSQSDKPLADLASNAYLVDGDKITQWE